MKAADARRPRTIYACNNTFVPDVSGALLASTDFGAVWRATSDETSQRVAVKQLLLNCRRQTDMFMLEVEALTTLRAVNHPNIVRLVAVDEQRAKIDFVAAMVLEHVDGDTFQRVLDQRSTPFAEADARRYFAQLVDALDTCHRNDIVHHDVSLRNVLWNKRADCVVLCDFGLSWIGSLDEIYKLSGTPLFAAPEIFLKKVHTCAVDVWSAGCVLYALLTKRLPFHASGDSHVSEFLDKLLGPKVYVPGSHQKDYVRNRDKAQPVQFDNENALSQDVRSLIVDGLLAGRWFPDQRITLADVARHAWMTCE